VSNNGPRFQARDGARFPAHECCFDAHVIDTLRSPIEGQNVVAECGNLDDAIIIALALNRNAMQESGEPLE
jgi:hypothetical protein